MSDRTQDIFGGELVQLLKNWCGAPVRLTILDPEGRERLDRVSGVVRAAGDSVIVDCTRPPMHTTAGAVATIEMMANGDHLFFRTTVISGVSGSRYAFEMALPVAVENLHRRRHPRIDLNVPVCVMPKCTGETVQARLRDLSAGGASLLTTKPLSAGDRAFVVFPIATGMYFHDLEGEVLRCAEGPNGEYVVAMQFHCPPRLEQALAEWVERRLAEESQPWRTATDVSV